MSKKSGSKKQTLVTKNSEGKEIRVVARNRAALKRWDVEETYEAGLVLTGTEVKSIRDGQAQIGDAYATINSNEIVLLNLHIGPYKAAGPHLQHEAMRPRKLLFNRDQIERIRGRLERRGYSLIPLDIHFTGAWAKVSLGLCRGKSTPDRREDIKKKEADREVERAMRSRR